jgi:hypothetical protein
MMDGSLRTLLDKQHTAPRCDLRAFCVNSIAHGSRKQDSFHAR